MPTREQVSCEVPSEVIVDTAKSMGIEAGIGGIDSIETLDPRSQILPWHR